MSDNKAIIALQGLFDNFVMQRKYWGEGNNKEAAKTALAFAHEVLAESCTKPQEHRTQPEALTIAYIAIGAKNALIGMPQKIRDSLIEAYGGELGVIDSVIGHALMADTVGDDLEHDCVWEYDIVEDFGFHLVAGTHAVYGPLANSSETLKQVLLKAGYDQDSVQKSINEWRIRQ